MDCLPTQVYEEDDFAPTQRIAHSVQGGEVQQVGILIVESKAYRINTGINTIGRSRTSNININNQTVSKNHAEIEATGGQSSAWICDLKSSNQTKLNNLTLQPGRSYELKDGSQIEFGHVSAVYKVLQPMDESIVPETPAPSRQKIIPVTPDSSLINSSAEDVSTIAATQDTEGKSIFRRPSLPVQRQSTGSRTSFVHDSSLDESTKENTKVSISQERSQDESGIDIHDLETQKICLKSVKNLGRSGAGVSTRIDIHEMETQNEMESIHDMETQGKIDIYNMETQRNVDIHDLETQGKIDIHDLETQGKIDIHELETQGKVDIHDLETQKNFEDISSSETLQIVKEIEIVETREREESELENSNISLKEEHEGVKIEALDAESRQGSVENNQNGCAEDNEQTEPPAANVADNTTDAERLQNTLKLTADSENVMDSSTSSLGSENLLEGVDIDEDWANAAESMTSTPKPSRASHSAETTRKSADDDVFQAATQEVDEDESIYDAATQRLPSMAVDAADVFRTISRGIQKKVEKTRKPSVIDDDSSDTDEEGRFAELAIRERLSASSFEGKANKSNDDKCDPRTSVESIDIFDALTQRVNESGDLPGASKKADSSDTANSEPAAERSSKTVNSEDGFKKGRGSPGGFLELDATEYDDEEPTQIIRVKPDRRRAGSVNSPTKVESSSKKESEDSNGLAESDETDFDDATPTQIIHAKPDQARTDPLNSPAKDESNSKKEPESSDAVAESVETDFDDATPTQIIHANPRRRRIDSGDSTSNEADKLATDALTQKTSKTDNAKGDSKKERESPAGFLEPDASDVDDMAPTQIIQIDPDRRRRMIEMDEEEAQIIKIPQKVSSNKSPEGRPAGDADVEDIDYEMAPTQVVRDVEVEKSAGSASGKSSRKINLDDTIERNLDQMFDDVNTEDIDEPSQMSTQTLADLLEGEPEEPAKPKPGKNNKAASSPRKSPRSNVNSNANLQNVQGSSSVGSRRKRRAAESPEEVPLDKSQSEEHCDKNIAKTSIESVDSPSRRKRSTRNVSTPSVERSEPAGAASPTAPREEKEDAAMETNLVLPVASSSYGERLPLTSKFLDDDDILAGLPEVRISGTLSHPPSPSSSTTTEIHRYWFVNTARRRGGKKNARKEATTKPSRKPYSRQNSDDKPFHISPQPSSSSRNSRNSVSVNLNVREMPAEKEDVRLEEKSGRRSSKLPEKREAAQSSPIARKKFKSSVDVPERLGKNASVQVDRTTRHSSKENDDHSSVFQVAKDVGVERTAKEAGRKRTGNRSQSMLNEIVRNDGKKRKAEAEEEAPVNKRRKSSAKTVNRRQSATILDFLGKREESPASGGSPVDGLIAKRAVVNVTRLSQNTPPAADEESDGYKINRNRRKVNQASSSSSKVKEADEKAAEKSTQKIRITRKQTKHEDVTSFVGEESQEVEMIMSNALPRDETEPNVARESKAKNTRSRRANVQKTAAWSMPESVANTRSTRAGRSSQSSQSSESLVEEEDQNTAKTAKRRGRPRKIVKKPMKSKAEKNESDEMQIEGSSSSENNSSIASHVSTPSRTRRSTSTSLLNTPLAQKGKHKILFTGITTEYGKLLSKLGASQVEDPAKCTVLVTDKVRRTLKFLCALAQAVPIVSIDWLIESERAGRFLEMDNYILKDPASEAKFGFKLRGSLEKARERKFLEGYTVIVTPNVSPPPVQELKHMIVSSGGKPLVRPPTSWPKNAVIVSREEDLANAKKFLAKAPKDVTIQSTEFILTGILRQELNFAKHKLT